MRRNVLLALSATCALAACGGAVPASSPDPGDPTRASTVTIEAIAYEPAELEVSVGDTVTWTNQDASVKHTVTSGQPGDRGVPGLDNGKPDMPDGLFDGSVADAGDTFEFTFDKAGTFEYFCRVHPAMTASVVVGK